MAQHRPPKPARKPHETTASVVKSFIAKTQSLSHSVKKAAIHPSEVVNPHKKQEDLAGQLSEYVMMEFKDRP